MSNILQILEIGFFDGLTWFPIVLAIGIIYKYLKRIDVSLDGITVISSITFTVLYNHFDSLILSFLITALITIVCYSIVSFLTLELKINNILVGIILSLILHSLSVIWIGESVPLAYHNIEFINYPFFSIILTITLAISIEIFFKTRFGIRLKIASDNQDVNIPYNPRILSLIIYIISGLVLSFGAVIYTSKIGLARSGGGFDFLITALSSFLLTDKLIDYLTKRSNYNNGKYSYSKYFINSLIQSPVFKSLVGAITFQIVVLLIIYYTNNPAYWKLIFGIILLFLVAKPSFRKNHLRSSYSKMQSGIVIENLLFQYDYGYEKKTLFKNLDLHFDRGINIIWGNNGVGKTTLLKIISGELMPEKGSIYKDGKNIITLKKHLRKVFSIKQIPYDSLSSNFTVYENAAAVSNKFSISGFNMRNLNSTEFKSIDFGILFGKENSFWVQNVGYLSGGQAQKLNLFLCSISDADIFLADEPTSGIDDENFSVFEQFINQYAHLNKIIIIATHDDRLKTIPGNHFKLTHNSIEKIIKS